MTNIIDVIFRELKSQLNYKQDGNNINITYIGIPLGSDKDNLLKTLTRPELNYLSECINTYNNSIPNLI